MTHGAVDQTKGSSPSTKHAGVMDYLKGKFYDYAPTLGKAGAYFGLHYLSGGTGFAANAAQGILGMNAARSLGREASGLVKRYAITQ